MEKKDIIERVKANFAIQELVCKHTYDKWKDTSWQFLQKDLLQVIDILRNNLLKVPMIINTWNQGGAFDERGLRCNLCNTVASKTTAGKLYLSPHILGAAIDFHTKEFTAEEIRQKIRLNWREVSDIPIRIEKDVTWVHIDVFDRGSGNLITEFNG